MIVVTGANGQIGRQVVNFLRERIPVSEIAVSVREPEKAADLAATAKSTLIITSTCSLFWVDYFIE